MPGRRRLAPRYLLHVRRRDSDLATGADILSLGNPYELSFITNCRTAISTETPRIRRPVYIYRSWANPMRAGKYGVSLCRRFVWLGLEGTGNRSANRGRRRRQGGCSERGASPEAGAGSSAKPRKRRTMAGTMPPCARIGPLRRSSAMNSSGAMPGVTHGAELTQEGLMTENPRDRRSTWPAHGARKTTGRAEEYPDALAFSTGTTAAPRMRRRAGFICGRRQAANAWRAIGGRAQHGHEERWPPRSGWTGTSGRSGPTAAAFLPARRPPRLSAKTPGRGPDMCWLPGWSHHASRPEPTICYATSARNQHDPPVLRPDMP